MVPRKTKATIKPPKKGKEQQATTQSPLGATFRYISMERTMRIFPVHESEISSLSQLNNLVTGFFSGAFALLMLGVGLVIDLAVEGQLALGQLTESGKILLCLVSPLCVVLALLLAIAGLWARGKRASIWQRIKDESTEKTE